MFRQRLAPRLQRRNKTRTELDPRRTLEIEQYLSLLMLASLNPVLKTARSVCAASQFARVQTETGGPAISLPSFSAMQHVVEPELLAGLLRELSTEALPIYGDDRLRQKVGDLIANDGTLLPALPRMAWALWQNPGNRAGKLHLEFSVWRQVPVEFEITDGNRSERAVWKSKLRKGAFYVNDRNYSHDYELIKEVQATGASFVLRLHNNAVITLVGEARPLTEADGRVVPALEKIVPAIRKRCPRARMILRGDSGFGVDEIMTWCESQSEVYYCLGIGKHSGVLEKLEPALADARMPGPATV